jgi:hypothetical protein
MLPLWSQQEEKQMAKDERGGIDRPGVLEIFGTPAPIGRHGLQRDMGEQHYGGRGGLGLQIVGNPGKLFGAQRAETAAFSRRGRCDLGEFEASEILKVFGNVSKDFDIS